MTSEEVLFSITGNRQFNNTNVDDISAVVREHPYFSPAQFILALKQKKDNSFNYQYQLQKASLYFSNQVWLNYLLNEKEVAVPDLHFQEAEPIFEPIIKRPVEEDIFPTSLLGSQAYIPQVDENSPSNEDAGFNYHSLFSNNDKDIQVPTLEAVKQMLGNNSEETSPEETPKFPSILEEPIAVASATIAPVTESVSSGITTIAAGVGATAVAAVASSIPSFSFLSNEESTPEETSSIYVSKPLQAIVEEKEAVEEHIAEVIPQEATNATEAITDSEEVKDVVSTIPTYTFKGFSEEAPIVAEHETNLSDAVSISEAFAKEQLEDPEEEREEEGGVFENNISSLISTQAEGFNKPVEENSKFEFENENHLHTVDYFASLGIKIDLTKQPQDKLTMQMRRFTDWLKQIKKTDPNPQDLGTDPELEKAIQNIAKTSIEAKEIVTETMADVFIKQGKVSKAIQLYIKLSFLDPAKSTYFANKIQQLKGI